MERRFVLFLILTFALVFGYSGLVRMIQPEHARQAADRKADPKNKKESAKPAADDHARNDGARPKTDSQKSVPKPSPAKPAKPAQTIQTPEPDVAEQWITLGSADPASPYRMLVTLTNRGAAVARIELNSPHYCDIDDRSGYLGHLITDPHGASKDGCLVQIVPPGTPAAEAGLKSGDLVKAVNGKPVAHADALKALLAKTRPKQKIKLHILRDGKELSLEAKLRRRPLEVIKPEGDDPLSLLLTLNQIDDLKIASQWARDHAIYALYADLKLSDAELAALESADVELSKEVAKVRLPGQTPQERQWLAIPENARKALGTWKTLRGEQPGPLFLPLPLGTTEKSLTEQEIRQVIGRVRIDAERQNQTGLAAELDGVHLRRGTWKVLHAEADRVVFQKTLPAWGLELTKTYRLTKVPQGSLNDDNYPAYHLEFFIEIRNLGDDVRTVAYRLDGPNGLPTEGDWYATRVTRTGGSGLRDFIISFGGGTPGTVGAASAATDAFPPPWPDESMTYIGVDAQYFSAVLLPQRKDPSEVWFDELMPIRVGVVKPHHPNLTNTSCRLVSMSSELKPGTALAHQFKFFAGPKKPAILENKEYKLGDLVYFGWPIFSVVAVPLTAILHWFYAVVGNYGLAIILLTIFVRGIMFPLSLKQAAGAQKMQLLQPEIKKLQEKYKNNVEARTKAQQELFRKHNYNPLSGCLPIFIQMPVFMGLYRSLMVAIELRDAPLITNSIRWCSNLAAPDMLVDWRSFMPDFIAGGSGIFALGPYFNLLPILTVVLFIWQQKMFMPPAADEQAAMQQKIMQYMMIFFGILFFKVASGLCIYFIASSLWSIAERQFLPKPAPVAGAEVETRAQAKARLRQTAGKGAKKA